MSNFLTIIGVLALVCVLLIALPGSSPSDARTSSSASRIEGKVRWVADGDTFFIGDTKIRLWGIDALETDQPAISATSGNQVPAAANAQKALRRIVKGQTVLCVVRHRDRHGRPVAQCYARGEDIGKVLVQQGHALDYPQYSKGHYRPDEAYARRNGLGIHRTLHDKPWIWRKLNP